MTDDVGLLLNVTFRLVGRTVPGAPPSDDGRRRFRAPPHRHARPASVDWRRYFAAPTLHQPLSHGAERRDSSPFRGAEGWAEVVTLAHLFIVMLIPIATMRIPSFR